MNATRFTLAVLAALVAAPVQAEQAPYAGQEARAIKALAPERIEGLRAGAGLGYAKAAELNGWPGPLHVLELADALSLSGEQAARVSAIRERMLAEARPLGADLIEAEAALDALFAGDAATPGAVAAATARIGALDARLRAVHLEAHIETYPLLTRHQRMIYAKARGYGGGHGHGGHGHGGHGNH